jgi:two-component system, chemotaxis family, chemotaxis protein CheV
MPDTINMDDIITIVDDDLKDTDELDLIKLISSNMQEQNQYLLFLSSDNQYYAINISKVDELLIYRKLDIVFNHDKNYIIGTTNIRNQITSVISFDLWLGNTKLQDKEYEHVIIASYNSQKIALIVKEVEDIVTIDPDDIKDNSKDNSKASSISQVCINGKDRLCTIFKDIDGFIL